MFKPKKKPDTQAKDKLDEILEDLEGLIVSPSSKSTRKTSSTKEYNESLLNNIGRFNDTIDAAEQLENFIKPAAAIKKGDYVELRACVNRYNFPDKERNQVAKVIHVFSEPVLDKEADMVDMVIAVALAPNATSIYPVNSLFYQKAGSDLN